MAAPDRARGTLGPSRADAAMERITKQLSFRATADCFPAVYHEALRAAQAELVGLNAQEANDVIMVAAILLTDAYMETDPKNLQRHARVVAAGLLAQADQTHG